MTSYRNSVAYRWNCPDCRTEQTRFGTKWIPCGLTNAEHTRVAKVRDRAEKQARKQAHALMVQERIDRQYPKALIGAVYNEAERRLSG